MKPQTRSNEAGWVLLEAVLLGMIVLGSAAAIGIFARTALLEEHAAARMEAALLARARFSMMEADGFGSGDSAAACVAHPHLEWARLSGRDDSRSAG